MKHYLLSALSIAALFFYSCDSRSEYEKLMEENARLQQKMNNLSEEERSLKGEYANAMNKLIADENNGVFDKNFQLSWDLYKDSIILTNEIGVKIVPLKLFNIVSI
jgi:hypothetical protein